MSATPHVEVKGLTVTARNGAGEIFSIVSDIDFALNRGEVLALIGESGSGKTTIALTLLGHARPGAKIAEGSIRVGECDLTKLDRGALAQLRGNRIAYIAQSAASAFNPSRTIMDQVVEPALIHNLMPRAEAESKAVDLFRALALPFPETIGARYPHQLSGGQLQRLMAAMALITDPELVILDEPTTALDVTTQIEVLRAFKTVVLERGATAIYVSHDLAVVAQMAPRSTSDTMLPRHRSSGCWPTHGPPRRRAETSARRSPISIRSGCCGTSERRKKSWWDWPTGQS